MSLFNTNKSALKWEELLSINDFEQALSISNDQSILIFKDSTRCSISKMIKNRLERNWVENLNIKTFYLDLLSHRDISDKIADKFGVEHQSPQILVIKNSICVYSASHNEIDYQNIKSSIL